MSPSYKWLLSKLTCLVSRARLLSSAWVSSSSLLAKGTAPGMLVGGCRVRIWLLLLLLQLLGGCLALGQALSDAVQPGGSEGVVRGL